MHALRIGCRRLAALLPLALAACSVSLAPPGTPAGAANKVITAAEIQALGATNALEALEQSGTHLEIDEVGLPRRARTSLDLAQLPKVIVDGVQMLEVRLLRDIPASVISSIRILSGIKGTSSYATAGENSVIVIKTRSTQTQQ